MNPKVGRFNCQGKVRDYCLELQELIVLLRLMNVNHDLVYFFHI